MESIDSLRTYCDSLEGAAIDDNHVSAEYVAKRTAINVRRYVDKIEQELEELYIKLPLDADGVPIHVGDLMERNGERFTVCAVAPAVIHTWASGRKLGEGMTTVNYNPEHCTHAKSRTLEDVLSEMLDRNSDGIGLREFNRDFAAFVKHYANEIRELLEVD